MENWKAGEMHGTFEVIQSLDAADTEVVQLRGANKVRWRYVVDPFGG